MPARLKLYPTPESSVPLGSSLLLPVPRPWPVRRYSEVLTCWGCWRMLATLAHGLGFRNSSEMLLSVIGLS